MRLFTACAMALGLSACASTDLSAPTSGLPAAVKTCTDQQARFVDAWGCVQAKSLLGDLGADGSQQTEILRFGDDLASQVSARRLSDAAAKKRLLDKVAGASGP